MTLPKSDFDHVGLLPRFDAVAFGGCTKGRHLGGLPPQELRQAQELARFGQLLYASSKRLRYYFQKCLNFAERSSSAVSAFLGNTGKRTLSFRMVS